MKITPEQASNVLINYAGDKQFLLHDFFEALRDGELPTYCCQRLALFKLYSDDLPGPILVDERHPDYPQMKCRGNIIMGIALELSKCVEQEVVIDPSLITSIDSFVHRQWNAFRGNKGEYWTTQEEIDLMNTMLDRVISNIETTYGVKTDWEKARQRLDEERKRRRKAYGV